MDIEKSKENRATNNANHEFRDARDGIDWRSNRRAAMMNKHANECDILKERWSEEQFLHALSVLPSLFELLENLTL